MLRQMRENTGSWIIKILLGVIVIAFVFIGFGSLGSNLIPFEKNMRQAPGLND